MTRKRIGFAAGRLERIGEHLQRFYIEPGKIAGCDVLVARHGEVAYRQTLGLADRERNVPIAEDTIYRIYSMTKPITSVALMMLFERGLFQLDDPVSRFFPDWSGQRVWVSGAGAAMKTEAARRPVSIRDVLRHTGGLTYANLLASIGAPAETHPVEQAYVDLKVRRERDETLAELMRKLAQVPLRHQPGERWQYSLSTDVCGALVEAISGKPLDRYFQEEIFTPLGMNDTAFFVPPEKIARFAALYNRGRDRQLALADDPRASRDYLQKPSFLSGGGGLVSTTGDYLRFCDMLRRGGELDGARILGPRTIDLMRANHLPGGAELSAVAESTFSETGYDGVGFGLGFASTMDKGGALGATDFYWGGAASTIFWVDPREDMVVIFMTQFMPSATFNFRGQLKNIIYSALVD